MKKSIVVLLSASLCVYLTLGAAQKIFRDVPYVPTAHNVVAEMLRIADVKKNDVLYDLGCGDGRIVITAAQNIGTRGVGVDIDPQRIQESRENATKANVEHLVQFYEQDLFLTDFSEATVVTLYLLTSVNLKLRPRMLSELRPGTRLVSHNYKMSEWLPDETSTVMVDDTLHSVYFWIVPANVTGTWELVMPEDIGKNRCKMRLEQVFQYAQGTFTEGKSQMSMQNVKLTGDRIRFTIERPGNDKTAVLHFEGYVQGNSIEGSVKSNKGKNEVKSTWRARRDPTTVKPLDISKSKQFALHQFALHLDYQLISN